MSLVVRVRLGRDTTLYVFITVCPRMLFGLRRLGPRAYDRVLSAATRPTFARRRRLYMLSWRFFCDRPVPVPGPSPDVPWRSSLLVHDVTCGNRVEGSSISAVSPFRVAVTCLLCVHTCPVPACRYIFSTGPGTWQSSLVLLYARQLSPTALHTRPAAKVVTHGCGARGVQEGCRCAYPSLHPVGF